MAHTEIIDTYIKDMDWFFYGGNRWQAGMYQLVENLTLEQAMWKLSEDRHCIWNIVKHILYWKLCAKAYAERKPVPNYSRGNWAKLPKKPTDEDWKKDLGFLVANHEEFKIVIKKFGPDLFDSDNNIANFLRQIINHDSYHSGQIGFLRAIQGIKPIE